jgi:transcriptional regulator with XRE-family HTH domain
MTVDNEINGSLLKLKRESLGWTLADMAARACLSTKQVRQLEEGGDNSFYSHAIKLTVAKKIAQILQISEDELFFRLPSAPEAEFADSPSEIDPEHLAQSQSQPPSQSPALNLAKSSDPEGKSSSTDSSATTPTTVSASSVASIASPATGPKKEADQTVSFASILTRSQSSSDDLDALLAEEDSTPTGESLTDHEAIEPTQHQPERAAVVAPHVSTPTPEPSHSETVGLPSTPSPITLSSASSSLSEDQHTQEQSIWVKVILAILVLMGALLIVAPKSFDGLAEKIEAGFKKADSPVENSPNTSNTTPIAIPALDASQSDTPVELSKPLSNPQEPAKPAPAMNSSSPALPLAPTTSAVSATPSAALAPSQQSNASIPTTAVPSANPSLGSSATNANPKQPSSSAVNNPAPVAPSSNGQ